MNKYVLIFFVLIGLASCKPKPIFEDSQNISESAWTSDSKLRYDVEIIDTTTKYELVLMVNHQDTFDYENLYIRVSTIFPDGIRQNSTVSVPIAHSSGLWLGKCRNGKCKIDITLANNFLFPQKGNYTFEIEQYSREKILKGINTISLKVYSIKDQN